MKAIFGWALGSAAMLMFSWALVWWPVIWHYRVVPTALDPAVVSVHRTQPAESVLTTVADASLVTDHPLTGVAAVAAARRLLRGELALPALPVLPINPGFAAADLLRGVPVQQLFTASLIVPDLLMRAYEEVPDPEFLAAAGRYLQGFVEYERRQWRPTGFLWNAHAVTNRVAVLARYWRLTRTSDASHPPMPQLLHEHAQRLGALLSNPSMFVAGTNHGVMQNLGLLQLAAAFPALPEAAQYHRLALGRLAKQLPFYLSSEGAVLEHSAGYHFHGVVLTGYLVRVLQASGAAVPSELQTAHHNSLAFMAQLQRPDRSLPLLGNTFRYAWRLPRLLSVDSDAWDATLRKRESFTNISPVAGAAVWWSRETPVGQPTHTVVTWGQFPGHGHQRAQEMSVLIWADGTDWSTNTGYWPGDDSSGEEAAAGWGGSNAPHVVGEPAGAMRKTIVRAQSQANDFRFMDLERSVANGGPRFRRQVLAWKGALWLVLDSYEDSAKRPLRVVWTSAPETRAVALGPRRFVFQRDGSEIGLSFFVEGSSGVTSSMLRGSWTPFGGWVAFDRRAAPAPSIDARLDDPSGWMLAVAQLVREDRPSDRAAIAAQFKTPEDWKISVPQKGGELTFARQGVELSITHQSTDRTDKINLVPGADVSSEHRNIASAGAMLRSEYPRVKTYEHQREQSVIALSVLWFMLLGATLLCTDRWAHAKGAILAGSGLSWLLVVWWVVFVYLRS